MEYPYDKPASAEPPAEDLLGSGKTRKLPLVLSPLLIAAFAFGVVNLLFVPIVSEISPGGPGEDVLMFLMLVVAGPLIAQFGILPAWLVWGQHSFWQRLATHWALAAGLAAAWSLGLLLSQENSWYMWREVAAILLSLPVVSLAVEAPLWITRQFLGWRIGLAESVPERPLAIRDFLWGMAIVSVSLAFVRVADAFWIPSGTGAAWTFVAIVAGISSVASVFVMLPLTWFLLRLSTPGVAVVAAGVYALVGGCVLLGIAIGIEGRPPPDPRPVAALFLFSFSLTASIVAALGVARGLGYRLLIGKNLESPAKSDRGEHVAADPVVP